MSSRSLFQGLLFSAFLLAGTAHAQLEIPVNDGFVTDEAGMLTAEEEETLEQDLDAYRRTTSNEIAVLVIPSLSGAIIEEFAVQTGRDWGVGGEENNNGILMVISYADRTVHMAVGYGLEGSVPDIVAIGIIEKDMAPYFRDAEYYEGITMAIDSLKKHIGGEYTAERYEVSEDAGFFAWVLFFIFICFNWLGAILGRTKSWWLGGVFGAIFGIILTILFSWWVSIPALVLVGLLFDYIVSQKSTRKGRWTGGGRGGWGGGSSGGSSGGFGGFGGGSFGGGGATGKW